MIANITNLENLIRGYVLSNLRDSHPNLDITENSSFDDLFIKPMVTLLTPVFEKLNSIDMMSNLANAEYMSEDDLDKIGEGNYLIPRKDGLRASTTLTLSFLNVHLGDSLVIPANITFQTSDGLEFQTIAQKVYSYDEVLPFYNAETTTYDIPVEVEATSSGEEYNVDANTITQNMILFNTNLLSVTNEQAVVNGEDRESNVDYAERIKRFYISRTLGTAPGYEAFIFENFKEVDDVCVVGFKDPLMTRDLVTLYNPSNGNTYPKHLGGMVDIYIKGSVFDVETTEIPLRTNFMVLSEKYDSIDKSSIVAFNNTDSVRTPVIASKNVYDTDKLAIVLNNSGNQSFNPTIESDIIITYKYTDPVDDIIISKVDRFIVGESQAVLSTPLKSIISLTNQDGELIPDSGIHYQLITSGDIGTTSELRTLKLKGFDNVPNGNIVNVNYLLNITIKAIGDVFNKEEFRVVTEDVRIIEAESVPINISIGIKPKRGHTLDRVKLSKVRASLSNFFSTKQLDDDINESDIVTWLTTSDSSTSEFIEYVKLPFSAMYIPENINDELTDTRGSTTIPISKVQYPVLNKINVFEVV